MNFTVPAGAKSGKVVVRSRDGSATSPMAFTVDPAPPEPPAPIPGEGFKVLIVRESADLTKLPQSQQLVLRGATVAGYLDRRCATESDGKTKAHRIFDKDADTSGDYAYWTEAMKRPRSNYPWIVISNGKTGFEGPLPLTVADTMALLQKYGG